MVDSIWNWRTWRGFRLLFCEICGNSLTKKCPLDRSIITWNKNQCGEKRSKLYNLICSETKIIRNGCYLGKILENRIRKVQEKWNHALLLSSQGSQEIVKVDTFDFNFVFRYLLANNTLINHINNKKNTLNW